jgi:hypothetical protein
MKPSFFKLHAQLSTLTAMVIFIAATATASHGVLGGIETGTIVYASVLMLIYGRLHKTGQAVPVQPQSTKPNIPAARDIGRIVMAIALGLALGIACLRFDIDLSPSAYLKFAFVPLLWALDMAFLMALV